MMISCQNCGHWYDDSFMNCPKCKTPQFSHCHRKRTDIRSRSDAAPQPSLCVCVRNEKIKSACYRFGHCIGDPRIGRYGADRWRYFPFALYFRRFCRTAGKQRSGFLRLHHRRIRYFRCRLLCLTHYSAITS